jgi:hypothetical protein
MCSGTSVEDREMPGNEQFSGVELLLERNRMREALNQRSREQVIRQLGALEDHG